MQTEVLDPQGAYARREGSAPSELSLRQALRILAQSWLLILTMTLAAVAAAGLAALLITPVYRAEVLLSPVEEQGAGGALSTLMERYAGLTALAGLQLGGKTDRKNEAIAILRSRLLTERFIERENLLPVLFAERWNAASQSWRGEPEDVPTMGDAYRYWDKKVRRVQEDRRTGLVTLAIEWRDPQQAAAWANGLVRLANATMAEQAIADAQKSLDYLNAELARTSVVEVRDSIFRLIEAQVKTIMLAKVREQYAFEVIDPAVAPDPDAYFKPQPFLMLVLAAVGGLLAGMFVAFARYALASP